MYCGYSMSMDSTVESPILISSMSVSEIVPILFVNLFSETERTWKQSAEDFFVKPFFLSGSISIIHGAILYLSFQSVIGTIIFNGNFPNESSLTIIAGRVFLISAPIAGSRLIDHTSPCLIKILIIQICKLGKLFVCFVICA